MIAWEPDGTHTISAAAAFAIVLGFAEIYQHGLPSWWPAPAGSAAMFIIAALALGVALARRPK